MGSMCPTVPSWSQSRFSFLSLSVYGTTIRLLGFWFSAMLGMGHRRRVEPCLLSVFSLLAVRLLPFTVTKPVTIQEMSKAVAPRDTNHRNRGGPRTFWCGRRDLKSRAVA